MQRRQSAGGSPAAAQQQPSDASPACSQASPAPAQPGTSAAAVVSSSKSAAEWTLDIPCWPSDPDATASSAPRVMTEDELLPEPDGTAALLAFRSGRRSFGAANPRLEKRLGEIRANQHAAREELKTAALIAVERKRAEERQAALQRQADAAEVVEQQNSVSDADLAASFAGKYGKFVPPSSVPSLSQKRARDEAAEDLFSAMPEVANPVQVRNAPLHAQPSGGGRGGGGGGGKKKKAP